MVGMSSTDLSPRAGRGRGAAGAPHWAPPTKGRDTAGKGMRSKTQRWERPEVLLGLRCHQTAQGQWS